MRIEKYLPESYVKWNDLDNVITSTELKAVYTGFGASSEVASMIATAAKQTIGMYADYGMHVNVLQKRIDIGDITITDVKNAFMQDLMVDAVKAIKLTNVYYESGVRILGTVTTNTPTGTETIVSRSENEVSPVDASADFTVTSPNAKAHSKVERSFSARKDRTETISPADRESLLQMPDLNDLIITSVRRFTFEFH